MPRRRPLKRPMRPQFEVPDDIDPRQVREALRYSQERFASMLGVSVRVVQAWERTQWVRLAPGEVSTNCSMWKTRHLRPTGAARVLLAMVRRDPWIDEEFVIVRIRLFASSSIDGKGGMPVYLVVAGEENGLTFGAREGLRHPIWPSMHRRSRRLPQNGVARCSRSRQRGRLRVLVAGVPLQRIRSRAGQVPHNTRGDVIKLDLTVDCLLHHRVDDRAAEATPFRLRHGRPFALSPAHSEDIAVKPPT